MNVKEETNSSRQGKIDVNITFDESMLRLRQTPFGAIIDMEGCITTGDSGGPLLPSKIIRIATPPLTTPNIVSGQQLRTTILSQEPIFLAPIQLHRPGIGKGVSNNKAPSQNENLNVKPSTVRSISEEPFIEPYPAPPFISPKPELYNVATDRPVVRLIAIEGFGLLPIAVIEVNPFRLLKNGSLEFYPEIHVSLSYEGMNSQLTLGKYLDHETISPDITITSVAQARRIIKFARTQVVNPSAIIDFSNFFPARNTGADYIIITDNHSWDEKSIKSKTDLDGDLVSIFQRLADWKEMRGIKARVVTVTDIVNGTYGRFTTGARDLQEVIRNFLKWAYKRWGISWVLLGGDTDIIPVRIVAGAIEGGIVLQDADPPLENSSFWTGSFLKMNVVNPGVWWPGNSPDHLLIRFDNGLLIPYDSTGTSGPKKRGWYFTTDETYTIPSALPTQFVRVNGPESEVKGGLLQWLYHWNMIPTDLYYSSILGKSYNISGKHDWDLSDNGIYGQHTGSTDLDGVSFKADISLGRAPVSGTAQATAFVDKVLAYERFRKPDGTFLDSTWIKRMLFVSSNWGGREYFSSTPDDPPGDNYYHHSTGKSYSLLKLGKPYEDMEWRLFVSITDSDIRNLPYDRHAAKTGRGWYFAKSAYDLSVQEIKISIPSAPESTVIFPVPTMWVVVYGSADELSPKQFIFDRVELDSSLHDQEELRIQIVRDFTNINMISRLYQDEIDLSPTGIAEAHLEHLTESRLRDSLNLNQHILSLSGHGSSDGCCYLSIDMAQNLSNRYHSLIAYADSCLTNQFDTGDAMSENILYNPNGGAVAYVGNTRFSWIGLGDDFQRAFFRRLTLTRHLGLLNDTRCSMVNEFLGSVYSKWACFSLNLMGDPEMSIWLRRPKTMKVSRVRRLIDKRKPFTINVKHSSPQGDQHLEGAAVFIKKDDFSHLEFTDSEGNATININDMNLGRLEIVVTYEGFLPYVDFARINGPEWITGTVTDVLHQYDTPHQSLVRLKLDKPIDGSSSRAWYARDSQADYGIILDAVTDAYISGKRISLYVDDLDEGGTIERFQFR